MPKAYGAAEPVTVVATGSVGGVPPVTVIGTSTTVPVVAPVTRRVAAPPGVPAGTTTSTDAVPYSSRMSVPMVLVTGNVPSAVAPSDDVTSASLASAAVDMASEVRPNVHVAARGVRRRGAGRELTPTARCEASTGSGGSPAPVFANSAM